MFGRPARLPIDLVFPDHNLPKIAIEEEVPTTNEQLTEVRGFEALPEHQTILKPDVEAYLISLKLNLAKIGASLKTNRDMRMDKVKHLFDRRIKKASYKVGDLVLCSHPKIAKGMRRGIAYKYHGPYRVKTIDPNGCNYVIKRDGKKFKSHKVHKNNLKYFFNKAAAPTEAQNEHDHTATPEPHPPDPQALDADAETEDETQPKKRAYIKNPNCSRWTKLRARIISSSETASSQAEQQISNTGSTQEEVSSSAEDSEVQEIQKLILNATKTLPESTRARKLQT